MIAAFTLTWHDGSSPFVWVKSADEILAKAVRKPRTTSESGHLEDRPELATARAIERLRSIEANRWGPPWPPPRSDRQPPAARGEV